MKETHMTRPIITKVQESEICRAALSAHLHYLASKPRPLHPAAPAEDEVADTEYAMETKRLLDEATALGRVLKRDELMAHERALFDAEIGRLS
jgi:hypothetical protein